MFKNHMHHVHKNDVATSVQGPPFHTHAIESGGKRTSVTAGHYHNISWQYGDQGITSMPIEGGVRTIFFIGQEEHTGTIHPTGHLVCSCGKVIEKVAGPDTAYVHLERHIRTKTNHRGSMVKGSNR